jgi:hypothetical protein
MKAKIAGGINGGDGGAMKTCGSKQASAAGGCGIGSKISVAKNQAYHNIKRKARIGACYARIAHNAACAAW